MKSMIISAFPACGKTYLYENQNTLQFNCYGETKHFSVCDSESSKYEKSSGWEKDYVNDIVNKLGTVDFIFISQYEAVLQELHNRGIPFVVIAPDNSAWISATEKQLIKQQWFGRFVLRDNSHIKDFDSWLHDLIRNYDNWTSIGHLTKHEPTSFFLLKENQYISDILPDLYQKKETYPEYNAALYSKNAQISHDTEDSSYILFKQRCPQLTEEQASTVFRMLPSAWEQLDNNTLQKTVNVALDYD